MPKGGNVGKKDGPCVLAREALNSLWEIVKKFGAAGRTNGKMSSKEERGQKKSNPLFGTNIFLVVKNQAVLISEDGKNLLFHEFERTTGTELGDIVKEIISSRKLPFTQIVDVPGMKDFLDEVSRLEISKTA